MKMWISVFSRKSRRSCHDSPWVAHGHNWLELRSSNPFRQNIMLLICHSLHHSLLLIPGPLHSFIPINCVASVSICPCKSYVLQLIPWAKSSKNQVFLYLGLGPEDKLLPLSKPQFCNLQVGDEIRTLFNQFLLSIFFFFFLGTGFTPVNKWTCWG